MPTKTLDERVARIEKIFWVVAVLAVIFGISGAWGLNALRNAKSEIESLRKSQIEPLQEDVKNIRSFVDKADDFVADAKSKLEDEKNRQLKAMGPEVTRMVQNEIADHLPLNLSNRFIAVERRIKELKGIPANLKTQDNWKWDARTQTLFFTGGSETPCYPREDSPDLTRGGNYVLLVK